MTSMIRLSPLDQSIGHNW